MGKCAAASGRLNPWWTAFVEAVRRVLALRSAALIFSAAATARDGVAPLVAQAGTLAGRGPRRGSRRCPLGLRRRWPAVGAGRLDHPGPPVERHRSERMVCGQRIHSLLLLFFCTPFRAPSSSLTVSLSHWRCPSSPPLPTTPLPPRPRHTQIASQLHVTAASGPTPPGAFPTCHGGGGGQPTPPGPLPPLARQDARLRGRPYRPVSGPGKTRSPPPLDTHLFIAVSCSRRPGCPRGIHHQRGSKRDTKADARVRAGRRPAAGRPSRP